MTDSFHQILNETRKSLEKRGIESDHRDELLALLEILVSASAQTDGKQVDEVSLSLASNIVSSQALLSLVKQHTAELNALRRLSVKLTSSLDMPTVLDAIVHEAMRLVNNTRAVHIYLYKNGKLEFGAALQSDGSVKPISEPREDGLTYAVARGGETIVVENIQDHPLYKNVPAEWNGSIIGIPLKMEHIVVGVMNLSRTTLGGFSASELRLLNLLSDQAAVAISNASLHQIISRKAYSDTVTGLPNRRALDERLDREFQTARRTGQSFSIIMMDLDGFKLVNDTYGHGVGDQVLRVFFNYMAQGLRSADFLARYGGDELTLIMSQTSLPSALIVGEKIMEQVAKFHFKAPDLAAIKLGISGGIAVYPTHGNTSADLLRAADEALYRAKKHARGKFLVAKSLTAPLNIPRFPTVK
ncbi:MAG: GGDEF domain-containing protein [Chloroflexi bacterium]|nr:GGDEF domain-containing protein [Chloroflexota bacterium]